MAPTIHSLPAVAASAGDSASLKDQIEAALIGTGKVTIPGDREEDKKWSFKRSVPTVVLYDEEGLRLYDRITSDAPEYYLFEDELNLLKTHGPEIARAMGFPGRKEPEHEKEDQEEWERLQRGENPPPKQWKPARWGDTEVGKWNNGVNGEQGMGGGFERGYDVVELGAGALRKTGHLLSALASALPPSDSNTSPITYHPLDLSYPELDRVLGEMDEAFGNQLKGKVECIGLHGDYEAGLQFIRDGKLPSLRQSQSTRCVTATTELLDDAGMSDGSRSPVSVSQLITPSIPTKTLEQSPAFQPRDDVDLLSPGPDPSPLPSSITDSCSEASRCGNDSMSGTWSPIETEGDEQRAPPVSQRSNLTPPPQKHSTSPLSELPARPLHLVFLGSSLGNFSRDSAAPFLKSLPLLQGDTLLLGLDGRPTPGEEGCRKVQVAYNDPAGHTRAFEEHGWEVVRQELGLQGDAGVEFVGRYNETLGRHEAYFRSKDTQKLHLPSSNTDVTLEKDELLNIEWSYKYSYSEVLELFKEADLRVINSWKAPESEYRLWLLERPPVRFTKLPTTTDTMILNNDVVNPVDTIAKMKAVPKWEDWRAMWKIWDHITLDMIPEKLLHQKPIDLRHICLFYLGHIPTFLDIHLTRMTNGSHTHPEQFKFIFERGIDPDVDDPTKIHSHSEVPTDEADWPKLSEILAFRDRVRTRLYGIYDQLSSGKMALSRHVGRVLFMTFEHEAMHAETLLYMLAQSPLTRPPSAVAMPQWEALARRWDQEASPNKVLSLPGGTVVLGHHDLEEEDKSLTTHEGWQDHEFGWDNEHPDVAVQVKPFKVDSLPISNNDYLAYLQSTKVDLAKAETATLPASWVKGDDGEWKIRSLYGPVGFEVGGRWPLMASKVEIDAYAKHKGGRMPTEAELRMLWENEEGPRPDGDLANSGFKNWHPVPPANTHRDNSGRILHGHNGGVWEWTSSEFAGLEGYVPSVIYPGYSADFYDGKHFVVLGGSFATVPNIVERRAFRNFYQANYRFSFIGGRVAYDV